MAPKHTFADTQEGRLAGAWRCADRTLIPICTWTYDLPAGLLRVTRGRVMCEFECPAGNGMKTDDQRRQILPHLALVYSRNIKRPGER